MVRSTISFSVAVKPLLSALTLAVDNNLEFLEALVLVHIAHVNVSRIGFYFRFFKRSRTTRDLLIFFFSYIWDPAWMP